MILTVTLNPSLDRLYHVDSLTPGTVTRVREVHPTAGGKGLNVARVAYALGETVTMAGLLGGHSGNAILDMLPQEMTAAFTPVQSETRICINVRDCTAKRHTEFLEPGASVTAEEIDAFLTNYRELLLQCDAVTLSGSLPQGCPIDFYTTLIHAAHAAQKPVLLDTSGAALIAGAGALPTLMKPNADEIAQLTGCKAEALPEVAKAALQLCASGIGMVVVSLGKHGALVACDGKLYRATTPDLPVVNTVGCGDSMLAGFAVGIARGESCEMCIRMGMAAATANALTESTGSIRAQDYTDLLPQITVMPYHAEEII